MGISIISWFWRNVVCEERIWFQRRYRRDTVLCRKWFWEMRRIWGLLIEFIKITLPFAPKRWTWETDSICIWARNWWNALCFSHKQLPYQTPEELEMVHCSRFLCRLAWEWYLATQKIFIYIAFLEWKMEILKQL